MVASIAWAVLTRLQGKLELITGVPVSSQSLSLYSTESDTTPIAELADDAKPLGFYGAQNMQMIKARRRVHHPTSC